MQLCHQKYTSPPQPTSISPYQTYQTDTFANGTVYGLAGAVWSQ
ncbi:MAG: hypothetical protein CAPSK01_001438 [Candidatus Accumulibacter vicinus]|uniref:Uncharacterized protein n=1 Tax=Candidatus Accumulibacter vicinus TaxID=2954382 RepID=A0A084Y1J1_9PROT|nr:MAG: hypothetical protein CAPSK01_001438 [Candidatus Accumulibacter vicinus]